MRVSAAGNMPLQGLVKPPAKPVVMIIKLCRKMFGSYQSAGILKFRFYQHLQFPMPQKSGNMLYIEQKKKSRRHEPSKIKKYPIRRKEIV